MSVAPVLPEKVVVLRTGGLGDFVLTIPLLVALLENECEVSVLTRPSYIALMGDFNENLSFFDADEMFYSKGSREFEKTFEDAVVLSFWKDSDGFLRERIRGLGGQRFIAMESRPNQAPHVVEKMFQSAGIQWEYGYLNRSWLGAKNLSGDCLWLHPGSGSSTKNAPLSWFLNRIDQWLAEGHGASVVVSFGEADAEVEKSFLRNCGNLPFEIRRPDSLSALRDELLTRAALFVGNDSGPSHLASALGVPTEVVFTSTNPEIWRPLGRSVTVIEITDFD
ncbi:MAG: glycosyltransferase family 9 protein [Opitutales bacterium]|jgi:ADP-heptose:LPS heptosyltransferase